MVAAVLGYDGQDISSPEVLNIANGLLEALSSDCSVIIGHFLSSTTLLVEPIPPSVWNESDEEQEFGFPDDVWQDDPIDEVHTHEIASNSVLLNFKDPSVEATFASWHNANLFKLDVISFPVCFLFALCILFAPPAKFQKAAMEQSIQSWRCILCFLPIFLLITARSRSLYYRHRELLITYTYFSATLWHVHVKNFMNCVSPSDFTHFLNMRGFHWFIIITMMLQIRFRLLLPLSIACFAVITSILPSMCATFFPKIPIDVCVSTEALKAALCVLVPPLFLLWTVERRLRWTFIRTVTER